MTTSADAAIPLATGCVISITVPFDEVAGPTGSIDLERGPITVTGPSLRLRELKLTTLDPCDKKDHEITAEITPSQLRVPEYLTLPDPSGPDGPFARKNLLPGASASGTFRDYCRQQEGPFPFAPRLTVALFKVRVAINGYQPGARVVGTVILCMEHAEE